MDKRKETSSSHFKVFGFMINPHEMAIISEDGQKLAQINVESDAQAKEKFMSETLNQQLIAALGRPDFSTIWVDDPAGDPAVMEACRKMEQGEADQLLADAITEEGVADDRVLQDEQHPEEFEDVPGNLPAETQEAAAAQPEPEDGTTQEPENQPVEEPPKAQFKPTLKTKIIEVECPETYTETEIKRLARNLQSLKGEALASAANYRE